MKKQPKGHQQLRKNLYTLLILGLFIHFFCVSQLRGEEIRVKISPFSPLRPGDQIILKVYNNRGVLEIDHELTVNESGEIDVPLLGLIKAAGLSALELKNFLVKTFSEKIFKNPRVQVSISKFVLDETVFIFGGVKNPGPYKIRDSISVMELIKMAGGFEDIPSVQLYYLEHRAYQSAFSMSYALDFLENTIVKSKGKTIKINLKKLVQEGDITQNIELRHNDIITIPRRTDVVPKDEESLYILGAVNLPGRYRYRNNLSVLDAISLAGGLTNQHKIKFASIIRGLKAPTFSKKDVKVNRLDLRKLLYRGDISQDQQLQPGDILLVSTREYRNVLSDLGQFIDNFLPIFSRANTVIDYDNTIRKFNDQFIK